MEIHNLAFGNVVGLISVNVFQTFESHRNRQVLVCNTIKFIYSEKATQFCEIFTLLLSYVVPVKSKVKI